METVEIQKSAVELAIEAVDKYLEAERANSIKRINAMHEAISKLKENGVENLPKGDVYDLRFGCTIEVKNAAEWGKIHKAVGKLQQYDKVPLGDGRSQKVKVIMQPEQKELQYHLKFSFERKLTKKDKCKVVTETRKVTHVVCSR